MTTTNTPITFDQAFALAQRLSPADKLRLIEQLAPQIAQVLETISIGAVEIVEDDRTDTSAFDDLVRLGQEMAQHWPANITGAKVLSAMRSER